MHDFSLPALVTLGIVVLLFVLAINVGKQRGIHKIDAPASDDQSSPVRRFCEYRVVFRH